MNKTSNEPDFSSIMTQVAKDDGTSRPIPLTNTVVTSGMSQTSNGAKPRSTQKRRVLSFLLCCLNASNRNRSKGPAYSPTNDASANHELTALTCEKHAHLESTDKCLLPAIRQGERVKICLVIDLDETLVHSSFKPVPNADFIVPVEIDGQVHQVYVTKRPHVDEFLRRVGELYECVLFTASLAKYADPVADLLDPNHVFNVRLFRESCTYYNGNYIKDLSRLGRDIRKVIIIDNSPVSYIFHQDNAVPVTSWFDDMHDTELLALIPIFERLTSADDVVPALKDIHRRRPMI